MNGIALLLASGSLLAMASAPALAEVRALLVGVADYHYLDADLNGPRNDVRLVASALLARGAAPGGIRILTTPGTVLPAGIAPAEDPTRAAILAGLDQLAAESAPGDTVIFYYSGHGSQAPDLDGDEAGGYDEILLPSDASGWKGAIGAVENAIIDDELQIRMQAILDTGARVVGILDACHAATGFRDLGGAGVARYVPPEALGIPDDLAPADSGRQAPPPQGDFVFLYSSQSDERSFEYPLGDRADPDNWFGDFTRNLVAVLENVPDLSWEQALAAAGDGLRREQASQTPDGEGPALAAPVFGTTTPAAGRLRVEDGRLQAGLLDGLTDGAEFDLFDAAAGGAALGMARLVRAQATQGELAFDGGELPALAYAELRAPGLPPPLRMAPPLAADGADHAALFTRIDAILTGGLIDGLEPAPPGAAEDYDLRLIAVAGEVAIVGRDGVLDPLGPRSSPRIPADAAPDVILGFVERAVRLTRLHTALAAGESAGPGFGFGSVGLAVSGEVIASLRSDGTCGEDAAAPPRALVDGAEVADCDQIWLSLANSSKTAQDVTVLYIDSDMRIVPIWPVADLSNRVNFGETAEAGLQVQAGALAAGREEIVVISVPARPGAPRTVLTGLADPAATRGAEGLGATAAWLLAAADPDTQSRSFRPGGKTEAVKVTRIGVTLAPR